MAAANVAAYRSTGRRIGDVHQGTGPGNEASFLPFARSSRPNLVPAIAGDFLLLSLRCEHADNVFEIDQEQMRETTNESTVSFIDQQQVFIQGLPTTRDVGLQGKGARWRRRFVERRLFGVNSRL